LLADARFSPQGRKDAENNRVLLSVLSAPPRICGEKMYQQFWALLLNSNSIPERTDALQ
jgi:hypothetical protein